MKSIKISKPVFNEIFSDNASFLIIPQKHPHQVGDIVRLKLKPYNNKSKTKFYLYAQIKYISAIPRDGLISGYSIISFYPL